MDSWFDKQMRLICDDQMNARHTLTADIGRLIYQLMQVVNFYNFIPCHAFRAFCILSPLLWDLNEDTVWSSQSFQISFSYHYLTPFRFLFLKFSSKSGERGKVPISKDRWNPQNSASMSTGMIFRHVLIVRPSSHWIFALRFLSFSIGTQRRPMSCKDPFHSKDKRSFAQDERKGELWWRLRMRRRAHCSQGLKIKGSHVPLFHLSVSFSEGADRRK